MRMMKPGCKASEIPVMLETVATAFDVKVVSDKMRACFCS
jgi:hypothetical protein